MRPIRLCVFIKRLLLLTVSMVLLTTMLFNYTEFESGQFDLKFIPEHYNICEQLFANTSVAKFFLSKRYGRLREAFNKAVIAATQDLTVEGFSRQIKEQYLVLHYLAAQPVARRICETGFNMGHSSFNFLTANERSIIHSFDFGVHPYSYVLSQYLKDMFPARFFIHFGNSMRSLPQFIETNTGFQCDLVFIDGGHKYAEALSDLVNFAKIANLRSNIVVFDDYPTDWGTELGEAWKRAIKEGFVDEIMQCRFDNSRGVRGFSIGRFVKRPDETFKFS